MLIPTIVLESYFSFVFMEKSILYAKITVSQNFFFKNHL